jgi:hypothetical protein
MRLQRGMDGETMTGFSISSRESGPIQTVRTIGRVAQMLVELRDEYVERPREDTLHQIEQRIDDLSRLRAELHEHISDEEGDLS